MQSFAKTLLAEIHVRAMNVADKPNTVIVSDAEWIICYKMDESGESLELFHHNSMTRSIVRISSEHRVPIIDTFKFLGCEKQCEDALSWVQHHRARVIKYMT